MGMSLSELDRGAMKGVLVWCITFSLTSCEQLGACGSFTWGQDVTRMYNGKKQRQCDDLPKHHCRQSTPLHGKGTVCGTWQRLQGVALASKYAISQTDWASVGCAGITSPSMEALPCNLQDLKGSADIVVVPDTRGHLRRSSEVDASMSPSCLWWHKGDPHNRQVVLISWLMDIARTARKQHTLTPQVWPGDTFGHAD